jgi:hypothetical protein
MMSPCWPKGRAISAAWSLAPSGLWSPAQTPECRETELVLPPINGMNAYLPLIGRRGPFTHPIPFQQRQARGKARWRGRPRAPAWWCGSEEIAEEW